MAQDYGSFPWPPEGGSGSGGGITSINGDTAASQIIVGSGGISAMTASGTTTISGAGFANTALSNLASTAVNADVNPALDVTHFLGSPGHSWFALYTANISDPTNTMALEWAAPSVTLQQQAAAHGDFNIEGFDAVSLFSTSIAGSLSTELRWYDGSATPTNYVSFRAPLSLASTTRFILPAADGSSGQAITTNASGTLGFSSFANQQLSNLGTTAINANLVPSGNQAISLGNSSHVLTQVFANQYANFGGVLMSLTDPNVQFTSTNTSGANLFKVTDFQSVDLQQNAVRAGQNATSVRFFDATANSTHYTGLRGASSIATSVDFVLPTADGSSGQFLKTDASGNLSFGTGVSSLTVASSNGFAGTSSGGATPALTLSTSITGILKGNGTAISAATAGTDYQAAGSYITSLTGDVTAAGPGAAAATIAANVVTNAKAAQMATLTIKGNNTGGTANASDLTVAQLSTMLAKQVVVGTPNTAASTTTSTTYAAFSTNTTVSLTAGRTGKYLVFGVFPIQDGITGAGCNIRINATSGSPTVIFSQEACMSEAVANDYISLYVYQLVTLTAATAYTFQLEGKVVGASTGTMRGEVPTNGVALVVQEL